MGRSSKAKADCRADTRGGSWVGIPKCLIDSAAYRHLSLHARAVLIEIAARMMGYNNGQIAVSHRELRASLGCSPRNIVSAVVELMEHGFLDVTADGSWKQRQARTYRLTFVSTKGAGATNDYLRWSPHKAKSGATDAVTAGGESASHAVAGSTGIASHAVAAIEASRRRGQNPAASHAVALIDMPSPSAEFEGQSPSNMIPLNRAAIFEQRSCEHCGGAFELTRIDRARPRRFCTPRCQKAAESARAYQRKKAAG